MSDFKVTSKPVSNAEAVKYADELEQIIGEILNGKRKPQNIPAQHIIALIQFARDTVASTANADLPTYSDLLAMLNANLDAWENEEDSVKEEHEELIGETRDLIAKAEGRAA